MLTKEFKKICFKYKYIAFLLIITIFFVFYNHSINETFDNNDERENIYQSAISQVGNDLVVMGASFLQFATDYHNNVLHGNSSNQ
tara:strand:- start:700 stop:954 length:255 start_codon:yes stop_codon:yes gene_type:complete